MPNKILKIMLKDPDDRTVIDNLELISFWKQAWGQQLKYAISLEYKLH